MIKIFKVDGMHCEKCASRVKNALLDMEGIQSIDINLESKEVKVDVKDNIDVNILKERIEDLGYTVIDIK